MAENRITSVSFQETQINFQIIVQMENPFSEAAGKPGLWLMMNKARQPKGVPPDPEYKGFDASTVGYDIHDIRKQTLWANIMAGGAGVEYYFGYQLPENDLIMEDYHNRDQSWDFCRIAIDFLHENRGGRWAT